MKKMATQKSVKNTESLLLIILSQKKSLRQTQKRDTKYPEGNWTR